jgi:hypothetical protein
MGQPTARDRVWTAIIDSHTTTLDVTEIRRQLRRDDYGEPPSDETIKRVLRAATDTGILSHTAGSTYWEKKPKHRKRFPVKS